ncbi:hypothetical protein [Niallia taxi]|uniref:Uncharacterized protein n=1 Tax=Niallia taxi TaxID=2499688 RepID=A0A437K2X4_9BACI|nr:hypothetical protein [Niallia taxi]RVT56441.1 hypothetical protein EM808_27525 [Niallia taxi]
MLETVKEIAQELNWNVESLYTKISTLTDIEVKLYQLRDDMEDVQRKGDEKAYYQEHFREIRILSELMNYCMKDLNKVFENTDRLQENLHQKVVNPVAGNDRARC